MVVVRGVEACPQRNFLLLLLGQGYLGGWVVAILLCTFSPHEKAAQERFAFTQAPQGITTFHRLIPAHPDTITRGHDQVFVRGPRLLQDGGIAVSLFISSDRLPSILASLPEQPLV